MERILLFSSSILSLAFMVLVSWFYLKKLEKEYGQKITDHEWVRSNPSNLYKVLSAALILVLVCAPPLEELIFRAVLVIIFPKVTISAWIAIIISALIFGAMHHPSIRKRISYVGFDEWVNSEENQKEKTYKSKLSRMIGATILGLISGYFSVAYQSIWLAFGIHALWNVASSKVVSVLILAVGIVVEVVKVVVTKLGRKIP